MIQVWTCPRCLTKNQSNIYSTGSTTVKCGNLECLCDYIITTTTTMIPLLGGRAINEDSTDTATLYNGRT